MTKFKVTVKSHGKPNIERVKKACERFARNAVISTSNRRIEADKAS